MELVKTDFSKECEPVAYWKLRALIGDVERCAAQITQLQDQLKALAAARTQVLQDIVGVGADVNFVTGITWNDDKHEITLTGVVQAAQV